MHITDWEASRSGAGITVAMTDAGGVRHKQFVKKIVSNDGTITAFGGDGARFPLNAGRDTSAEVGSIAGELVNLTGQELWDLVQCGFKARDAVQIDTCDALAARIRSVAASALSQRD